MDRKRTASAATQGPLPIYAQIEEHLRARIAGGELEVGAKVPSENELSRQFTTTRSTVRQALARLEFEGLIARRPGLGTFVAEHEPVGGSLDALRVQTFEDHVGGQRGRVKYQLLAFERVPAPGRVAEELELPPGTPVHRLERLRYVDGRLVGVEERFIPAPYGDEIPRSGLHDLNSLTLVARTSAGPMRQMLVAVRAAAATGPLAEKLEIAPRSPVLVRDHRYIARSGRPVLCGSIVYRADRYQFTYVLEGTDAASGGVRVV